MIKLIPLMILASTAMGSTTYVESGASVLWPAPYVRVGQVTPLNEALDLDIGANFAWGLLVWPCVSGSAGLQFKTTDSFSWGPEMTLGLAQFTEVYGHAGARFKWATGCDTFFTTYIGLAPYRSYTWDRAYVYQYRHVAPTVSFGWGRSF